MRPGRSLLHHRVVDGVTTQAKKTAPTRREAMRVAMNAGRNADAACRHETSQLPDAAARYRRLRTEGGRFRRYAVVFTQEPAKVAARLPRTSRAVFCTADPIRRDSCAAP